MNETVIVTTTPIEIVVEDNSNEIILETKEIVQVVEIAAMGAPGAAYTNTRIVDEVPSGSINGSNATFTTAENFIPESVELTLNGIAQRKGASYDYTTTGNNTIIFNNSPDSGDTILVDYEVL